MRKQFFRPLTLEELEKRDVPNMIVGQLGITEVGSSSVTVENGNLGAPSLLSFNALAEKGNQATGDNWVSTNSATLISDGAVEFQLAGLPSDTASITSINEYQQGTASNPTDIAFDPFRQDLFDVGFSSRSNHSPFILAPSGDFAPSSAAMPSGMVFLDAGSSSSSGGGSAQAGGSIAAPAGSLAMATPPRILPNMLLSSGHMGSPAAAGSLKNSPGSPAFSGPSGITPLAPACLDPVCYAGPAYVPVNADDDNGSQIITVLGADGQQHGTGIPAKRDFSITTQTNFADPELLRATIWIDPSLGPGAFSVSTGNNPSTASGKISLWTDQMKTAKFTTAGPGTTPFYIEGTHESSGLNDTFLTIQYVVGNQTYGLSAQITVTPLINSFGVTPNADAGDPNKQNVVFQVGANANNGLKATTPMSAPGALFKAVALVTNLSGGMRFIQNVTALDNGHNGTMSQAGAKVGWLFANGTSAN